MPTCKDCLHIDVCEIRTCYMCDGFACDDCEIHSNYGKIPSIKNCKYFKDRNRFVELPCKIGDTVFVVNGFKEIDELEVDYYVVGKNVISVGMVDDGEYEIETVFLTREEAEQSLKERERNGKKKSGN